MSDTIEPPPYLSPSSADVFEGCPRRWKFKYIDRLDDPSGRQALVGTFAHRVLELLCEYPCPSRTIDQAKVLARSAWPEVTEDPDYQALELTEEDSRSFRWEAWLAIEGLWTIEDPATVDVVSTEQRIKTELGSVPFVGVIDRVDRVAGKLIVSDYKSGMLPAFRWRGEKVRQVMLYGAALESATGELPDRVRLLYLRQRIVDEAVTPRRVEEAVGGLGETWTKLKAACDSETFEATPTVLCGWCPFVTVCPEGQAELALRAEAGTLPAHAPGAALVNS